MPTSRATPIDVTSVRERPLRARSRPVREPLRPAPERIHPVGERIRDMRNLGPATERMLAAIDVTHPAELRAMGAEEAYRRLRFRHGRVSRNALHALRGALEDRDWRDCAASDRDPAANRDMASARDPASGESVAPAIRIVPGEAAHHAAPCAAILNAWIDATPWMPRIHTPESVEWFVREVVFAMRRVWVALDEDGNGPAGFLALDVEDTVTALYVAEPARRAGIGSALLARAKAEAPGGLELWTFQPNAPARAFYAREGFVELRHTDGDNEEGVPDVLLRWEGEA